MEWVEDVLILGYEYALPGTSCLHDHKAQKGLYPHFRLRIRDSGFRIHGLGCSRWTLLCEGAQSQLLLQPVKRCSDEVGSGLGRFRGRSSFLSGAPAIEHISLAQFGPSSSAAFLSCGEPCWHETLTPKRRSMCPIMLAWEPRFFDSGNNFNSRSA